MVVYIAAAACTLFYLCMVPLKLALVFHTRPQPQLRAGTAAFEGRFALRQALRRRMEKRKGFLRSFPLSPTLKAGRYLLGHMRLETFRAQGVVAGSDAAQTALMCGAGNALHSACAGLDGRIQVSLTPDFSARESTLELTGMISVRLGHIITAALIFALAAAREAILQKSAAMRAAARDFKRFKHQTA